jgi:hypothetical protein
MIFDLRKIYGAGAGAGAVAAAVAAENILEVFLHFSNGTTGMLCRFFLLRAESPGKQDIRSALA